MSGITPLLDTLLHQVLGKRVDIPVQRELNEPVRPMDPGRATRAVHSDSRLDARQPGLQALGGAVTREGTGSLPTGGAPQGAPPSSTHTHFSPSARTIADLLIKFPAPPSTLRPPVPLLPSTVSFETTPAQLASQLQSSINSSGLFYESHLARWYRGELPRQALTAEPQMQRSQGAPILAPEAHVASRSIPSPPASLLQWPMPPVSPRGELVMNGPLLAVGGGATAVGAGERGAAPVAPLAQTTQGMANPQGPLPATPPPVSSPVASNLVASASLAAQAGGEMPEAGMSRGGGLQSPLLDPLGEALQGLVRHQLEMLVTPILRWEGDVWSGVFMALMIQVPGERERRHPREEHEGDDDNDGADQAWRSSMSLRLPELGHIDVELRLWERRVALTLTSESPTVVERLDRGREVLRERLEARGFEEVALLARLSVGPASNGTEAGAGI